MTEQEQQISLGVFGDFFLAENTPKKFLAQHQEGFESWFIEDFKASAIRAFQEVWERNDLFGFLEIMCFTEDGKEIGKHICRDPAAYLLFLKRRVACSTRELCDALGIVGFPKRYQKILTALVMLGRRRLIQHDQIGKRGTPHLFAHWGIPPEEFRLFVDERRRIFYGREDSPSEKFLKLEFRNPIDIYDSMRQTFLIWLRKVYKSNVDLAFREIWENNDLKKYLKLIAFTRRGKRIGMRIARKPDLFLACFNARCAYDLKDVQEALDVDDQSAKYRYAHTHLRWFAKQGFLHSQRVWLNQEIWVFGSWDLSNSEFNGFCSYKKVQWRRQQLADLQENADDVIIRCAYPYCNRHIRMHEPRAGGVIYYECNYVPKGRKELPHGFLQYPDGSIELLNPIGRVRKIGA